MPQAELEDLFRGYGYEPFTVAGDDPMTVHQEMAATLDTMMDSHRRHPEESPAKKTTLSAHAGRCLILRTPKGWTGPKEVDGKPVENTWRSHQVPFSEMREKPEHVHLLAEWMKSYKPGRTLRRKRQIPRRVMLTSLGAAVAAWA